MCMFTLFVNIHICLFIILIVYAVLVVLSGISKRFIVLINLFNSTKSTSIVPKSLETKVRVISVHKG